MGNQETGPNTGGKTKNKENGKRMKERSLSPPSRAPETEDKRQKTEDREGTKKKHREESHKRSVQEE